MWSPLNQPHRQTPFVCRQRNGATTLGTGRHAATSQKRGETHITNPNQSENLYLRKIRSTFGCFCLVARWFHLKEETVVAFPCMRASQVFSLIYYNRNHTRQMGGWLQQETERDFPFWFWPSCRLHWHLPSEDKSTWGVCLHIAVKDTLQRLHVWIVYCVCF